MTQEIPAVHRHSATSGWRDYPDLSLPPILASALGHFQNRGYHGTTVRDIAAGVDLTMPTLYYHYGSKDGMLFALLEIAMDDLQSHVDRCLDDAGVDTLTRFKNFVTTLALHYIHRRDLAMLHNEFRFLGADFQARYLKRRTAVERTLEELVEEGSGEGLFDATMDPHFAARVILGMLGGNLSWFRETGPTSASEIAGRYTEFAVRVVTCA